MRVHVAVGGGSSVAVLVGDVVAVACVGDGTVDVATVALGTTAVLPRVGVASPFGVGVRVTAANGSVVAVVVALFVGVVVSGKPSSRVAVATATGGVVALPTVGVLVGCKSMTSNGTGVAFLTRL